ncbi:sensor histidine kinase [Dokdonella sp.]|uniref:sensor histidine kinase n=1 Tax=Dokdonella sp. TaxID=2291710 RepID=UPI001B1FB27A|nr:sensor histidine kinase [Dokdonella sp.]MBO9663510.1 sensor histidine kinase [Dokdonella sp.]
MSMRLQLNLLVASLIAVFTAVVLAFKVIDTRRSVREETEAANKVATQLLEYFVETYAQTSRPIVLHSLERLGRVRSTEIVLRDADGTAVYHSPPSPYKAGRDAPAWYAALVAPQPMRKELRFADSVLEIESNASRAVLDGWDDTLRLLQVGAFAMLLGNLLVFWLVRRMTRPFRSIVRGLEDMQAGAYHTRLPEFAGAEAASIARAFNRSAQAIEDNLDARREAIEATLRLQQSRELAAAVQSRVEDERRQIARELHDETGQGITAIRSLAQVLLQRAGDPSAREAAQLIADTAARLYDATHALIPRLRPPSLDARDLAAAIEDALVAWRREQPRVTFAFAGGDLPESLGENHVLAAYRIVQEAVTNALRHAQAQRIDISVGFVEGALEVEVSDDGRGLAADWRRPGHYGVRGMDERAQALGGAVEVADRDGGGVRVRARLPLA